MLGPKDKKMKRQVKIQTKEEGNRRLSSSNTLPSWKKRREQRQIGTNNNEKEHERRDY